MVGAYRTLWNQLSWVRGSPNGPYAAEEVLLAKKLERLWRMLTATEQTGLRLCSQAPEDACADS